MQAYFGSPAVFPVSLGYSCHVKVFLDMILAKDRIPTPRLPFDWIGTPMWSICKLLENNFDRFADKEALDMRPRFVGSSRKYITHSIYNTVFLHDYGKGADNKKKEEIPEETWKKVEDDYKRRVERFDALLTFAKENNRTLLFVRLEPDKRARIDYPEFQQEHDERHFLEMFAGQMKQRGVRFLVLYLSTTYEKSFDAENGICYVKYGVKNPNMILSGDDVQSIYAANMSFIQSCIHRRL